jgi:DNA-binding NtrC family response regulator
LLFRLQEDSLCYPCKNKRSIKLQLKNRTIRSSILIVDDEPDIMISFEKGLRDDGFEEVDTANDPLLSLKNFKAGSYDLLIIDIIMTDSAYTKKLGK